MLVVVNSRTAVVLKFLKEIKAFSPRVRLTCLLYYHYYDSPIYVICSTPCTEMRVAWLCRTASLAYIATLILINATGYTVGLDFVLDRSGSFVH